MRYGIQITTAEDGAWIINQLVQKQPNGEYTGVQKTPKFIDHSNPNAANALLDAITRGLNGKLHQK